MMRRNVAFLVTAVVVVSAVVNVAHTAEECRRAGTVHLGATLDEISTGEAAVARGEHPERFGVSQPNVSKLEAAAASPQAGAIYLSTLGGYIAALGGHLEVRAVFPEHPEDDVVVAVGRGWVEEPDAGHRDG